MVSSTTGETEFDPPAVDIPDFDGPEEAARILEELLVDAVARRMKDGAMGGVALSGGLDSSIVAALAASLNPKLELFSTTIERRPSPDLEYARLMAESLGLEHHIYRITDEQIRRVIPEAVWLLESFDEDCISGAVANYYTSRLAAEHTRGILVGEGADELFGGYFGEMKDIPDERQREEVALRLVASAYNTALRRLDRGWLSGSVSYRTPFLDPRLVAFSAAIPMALKVRYDPGQARNVEKWILRRAMKRHLPREIADRPKLRFAGGTGVDSLMDELVAGETSEEDFRAHPRTEGGLQLSSRRELHYYRLFRSRFPLGYEKLTVRWDPFK